MDKVVETRGNCEARYDAKFLIGMLYVDGYKDNPIHISAKSEEEMLDKMRENEEKISTLVRDSEYIKKSIKAH